MANTVIKFKRSSVPSHVPTVNDIGFGELAINTFSGKLYTKKNDGVTQIVEIGAGTQYFAGQGINIDVNNVISSLVTSNGPTGRVQTSNGSGGFTALPAGGPGQVLTSNGVTANWEDPSGGVSSVNASGGTTGFTFTGGPITDSGTLTMGGTLSIANGGTGATTAPQALTNLLPTQGVGTGGYVLTSNGTNATWAPVSAAGTVTSVQTSGGTTGMVFTGGPITSSGTMTMSGILSISNGGTGANTAPGALNNLLPPQGGQPGYVLTTNGSTASWQPSAGGVTSVNASGGTTGLLFTGGPITSSGTLTMSGVLGVANGGTGQTTLTGLMNSVLPPQAGNAGKYLQTNGSTPSWQTVTASPGGASTQVQFNLGGVLSGDVGLTYNASTLSTINLTSTGTANFANVNTTGRVTGNVIDVAASAIDTSLGNYFRKVVSGALTWTFTNAPPNLRSYIFVLRLQNGGTGLQTWPASVVWPGGTAPTLSASGYDLLLFETDNGGSSWRGAALLNYSA